jgi:hypothetical protein
MKIVIIAKIHRQDTHADAMLDMMKTTHTTKESVLVSEGAAHYQVRLRNDN